MKYASSIVILVAAIAASGCSHVAPRYGISANNVESLRSVTGNGSQKVSVGPFETFEAGLKSIGCRGAGPVEPPDGITYEKYIEEAVSSELKLAQAYASDSPIRLRGKLDYITFNSNIFAGKWQIDMTFQAESVPPFTINTIYPFSTNFAGSVACGQVATALPSAVQDLITKLVAHPSFKQVLASKR